MRSGALVGLLLGIVAAGCGFRTSSGAPADGAGDSAIDSAPPVPDACVSFATLLPLDTCQLAFDDDLVIPSGAAVYHTGTHTLTVGGASMPVTHTTVMLAGESAEVISARAVTLASSATLRAEGPLPLVIAASTLIVVNAAAQIDVSDGGAGAQPSCDNGALPGAPDSGGAGGGGGGGYGADGGEGGDGDKDGGASAGGAKGRAFADVPAGLRGGCLGASGGKGGVSGGAGGKAGGALYLVAASRIELSATGALNAGGGPGLGGPRGDTGGGGGGSGGLLVLEAPHVFGPSATIAANGGGGGGGGDSGAAGESGAAGTVTNARADGGRGTATIFPSAGSGIDGGKGGSKDHPAGDDVIKIDQGGGGGGGGSVGIIRIKSADLQLGMISPEPR